MKRKKQLLCSLVILIILPALTSAAVDETAWNTVLKEQYFSGKKIQEGAKIIDIEAPYRAEDPALVPIKITSKIAQTQSKYIKKLMLFVDKNPYPFVAEFDFTPKTGKADLALRIRVNTYSYVRAIAEMNDGKLYMVKKFVKASGGCSAPIGADMDAAMKRLGKMKFRLDEEIKTGQPTLAQLLISHPNVTGMQMNQVTRFISKSNFVEKVKITYNGEAIITAKTDIAVSADPNFRFYFIPDKPGILKAEISDISCESPTSRAVCKKGKRYSKTLKVEP